jgi:hypothetical protein
LIRLTEFLEIPITQAQSERFLPHGFPVRVGTPLTHFTLLEAVSVLAVYPDVLLQVIVEYAAPCATTACATVPMKGPPIAMLTSVTLVEPVHEVTERTEHITRLFDSPQSALKIIYILSIVVTIGRKRLANVSYNDNAQPCCQ